MSDVQLVAALEPGRMERLVDVFVRQCLAAGGKCRWFDYSRFLF